MSGEFARLPIFPLSTVLLPGSILQLRLFEPRYLDMASHCLRTGDPFGICLIREGHEVGTPAVPEPVGCTASISECDSAEQGILKVKVHGEARFRLGEVRPAANGLLVGDAVALPLPQRVLQELYAPCADFLRRVIGQIGTDHFLPPFDYRDAGWVSLRLTEILPIRMIAKQKLLELDDGNQRMEVLSRFMREQKLV